MSFGVPGAFGSSCRAFGRPRRAFTVAQFVKDDLTSRHAPAMFGSSRPDPLNSQIRRLVDCSGVSFNVCHSASLCELQCLPPLCPKDIGESGNAREIVRPLCQ